MMNELIKRYFEGDLNPLDKAVDALLEGREFSREQKETAYYWLHAYGCSHCIDPYRLIDMCKYGREKIFKWIFEEECHPALIASYAAENPKAFFTVVHKHEVGEI